MPGLPAPVVTTGTPSSTTILANSSACGCIDNDLLHFFKRHGSSLLCFVEFVFLTKYFDVFANTTIIAELSDKSRIIVKIIYPLQFWHSSLPFYKESGGTRRSIFRTKAFAPGPAAKAEFREGGRPSLSCFGKAWYNKSRSWPLVGLLGESAKR